MTISNNVKGVQKNLKLDEHLTSISMFQREYSKFRRYQSDSVVLFVDYRVFIVILYYLYYICSSWCNISLFEFDHMNNMAFLFLF